MKLSLYLTENQIQVVIGRAGKNIQVKHCAKYDLREGIMINDLITDRQYLKEVLTGVGHEYPRYRNHINLILGSKIVTKIMQVPVVPKYQLLEMAKKELQYFSNTSEDMIYDYSVICRKNKNNKGGSILCAAIERQVVDLYSKLFAECRMKIQTMSIGLNAIAHLAEYLPVLWGKTYILSIIDGRNMMSLLYVNGIFTYTSRIRLLSGRDSMEIFDEVMQELLAIIRFHSAQRKGAEIEAIYLCGLSQEEEENFFPEVYSRTGICVEILEAGEQLMVSNPLDYRMGDYIYATGNLLGR